MTGVVLVRYGELFLKSDPVQRHFIGLLLRNCGRALSSQGIAHRFEVHRGRILIHGDDPGSIATAISRVFGVVDVSVARLTASDAGEVADAATALARDHLRPGMTFAVRARRQGVQGITSQELAGQVGAAVREEIPETRVDLTNPGYEIHAELREFGGLVYDSRIAGPGGLPWGSQGKAVGLLSGGIDSPVASWLMMKRGCEVTHLFLDGGRWAGNDVRANAVASHRKLSLWTGGFPARLLVIGGEALYDGMAGNVNPRNRCVICKRFMLRAGCEVARQEGALALVTGENLGQVASQTLKNLAVISGAADLPILRPLITFDKNEVVTLARSIGTFVPKPGDVACRAVPRMPVTGASGEIIAEEERSIGIGGLVRESVSSLTEIVALNGEILP